MKAKKKITIDLDKKDVADIIRAYFVNNKDIVIQDVEFNISEHYADSRDNYGTYEFDSVTCTREDDIEV